MKKRPPREINHRIDVWPASIQTIKRHARCDSNQFILRVNLSKALRSEKFIHTPLVLCRLIESFTLSLSLFLTLLRIHELMFARPFRFSTAKIQHFAFSLNRRAFASARETETVERVKILSFRTSQENNYLWQFRKLKQKNENIVVRCLLLAGSSAESKQLEWN